MNQSIFCVAESSAPSTGLSRDHLEAVLDGHAPRSVYLGVLSRQPYRSEERRVGKDVVGVDLGGRRIIKKIFFFKQKTAYEMLSGDWSSDVCSSDLWKCIYS